MIVTSLLREEVISYIRDHSFPIMPNKTGYSFNRITASPPPKPFPKIVLFDIYGTLFVSGSGDISLEKTRYKAKKISSEAGRMSGSGGERLPDTALLKAAKRFGLSDSPETIQARFLEKVEEKHRELKPVTDCPEVRVEEIWSELFGFGPAEALRFAAAYECAVNPVYPMPGLKDLLDSLRESSLPLGIISNAQIFTPLLFDVFLDRSLEELGFTRELCAYSYLERVSKPCTELFVKVRDALPPGTKPGEVLYIGNDMLNDITPAAETGFRTALFAGDERSLRLREDDSRCKGVRPDWIINSLADIVKIIIQ